MKRPAFQFYPADWLADAKVQCLTLEEEGAYIRLICYCWREGSIPRDSSAMAQLCKNCSLAIVERVAALFVPDKTDTSRLIHKRLSEEMEKQLAFHKERSESGLRGVTKRWAKEKSSHSSANDQLIAKNSSSSSSSSSDQEIYKGQLPEIPPMTKLAFDQLAQMRGVSKECADWYWNDCDKCNWLDTRQRPIMNPEPGLMNTWATWRSNAAKLKTGSGRNGPSITAQFMAVKQQIETHPANREFIGSVPHPSPEQKQDLSNLRKRRDDLNRQIANGGHDGPAK